MELYNIGKELKIPKYLYDSMKEFQESSTEEQNRWCGYCGCEGGCNLCDDLSKYEIIEDETIRKREESQRCII